MLVKARCRRKFLEIKYLNARCRRKFYQKTVQTLNFLESSPVGYPPVSPPAGGFSKLIIFWIPKKVPPIENPLLGDLPLLTGRDFRNRTCFKTKIALKREKVPQNPPVKCPSGGWGGGGEIGLILEVFIPSWTGH